MGEETNTHHTAASFQVLAENDQVSPELPFLQTKHPQWTVVNVPSILSLFVWKIEKNKFLLPVLKFLHQLQDKS